jgi:hypothetical protein
MHSSTGRTSVKMDLVKLILTVVSMAQFVTSQASAPRQFVPRCNLETLKYFRDSVKFHLYPTRDTWVRACDDEYANYKGCCDTESLRDLMKKFVMSDALRWNNALTKVNIFESEVIKNTAALKAKIDSLIPVFSKAVENKQIDPNVLDSAQYLSKYLPILTNDTYSARMQAYKGQAQACFDTLTQVRKGAMCILCSSRAQQFYKNNLMNIKQTTCDSIVRDCYANFQFMFTVMSTMQSLYEIANTANPKANFTIGDDPIPYKSKPVQLTVR